MPKVGQVAAIFVATVWVFLLILERVFPLRRRRRSWARRFAVNVCVSASALAVGAVAVRPAALGLSMWASARRFGLLNIVELPLAAQLIAGFLLLDVTFYYWHRANHHFRILWRFHNVHHIDPDLDASTAFRFHFGEVLYSTAFRALQVSLLGISPVVLVVYEIVFQCATIFHHSNICIPIRIERRLNKVVVTPRMHGIHHSIIESETNSNYSVVFRWWDVLHKSLRLNIPQADVIIGVAGYQVTEDNTLLNVFALPFLHQREYWRMPDGRYSVRDKAPSGPRSDLHA